jgi:hypothetical protein
MNYVAADLLAILLGSSEEIARDPFVCKEKLRLR